MIGLITTLDVRRIMLIPHFVGHYRRMGVDRFHISLNVHPDMENNLSKVAVDTANTVLRLMGLKMESVLLEKFDAATLRLHHNDIQLKYKHKYKAIVWADFDEFHEFPQPLSEIVDLMYFKDISVIGGKFVDRVSRSGQLQPVLDGIPIWSQFPIGCNFSLKVLKASDKKVILTHPNVKLTPGNHGVYGTEFVNWWPQRLPVHHFKWDSSIIDRLSERLTDDWKARCYWWTQSEIALSTIKESGEKIPLSQVDVYDFMDDDLAAPGPYKFNPRYTGSYYW
jgi:hypothetical protein